MMEHLPMLRRPFEEAAYPLLFVTVSGAHLYGFPSPDSDFDLRGVHQLPLEEVVGLKIGPETIERSFVDQGIEIDRVTHDVKKFFDLVLRRNGYVLEQIHSPLVVFTSEAHEELKNVAHRCVTRHHVHHYLGFAATQWRLFRKADPPRVKPLLYVYRVLLTGIHLMRTGIVEANLRNLNLEARLSHVEDLIERKLAGPEKGTLDRADLDFHAREYERLVAELRQASHDSHLPGQPQGRQELHELLVRIRLGKTPIASRQTPDLDGSLPPGSKPRPVEPSS